MSSLLAQDHQPDSIYLEVKNHIGFITLNRPQALNAINLGMTNKLLEYLDRAEKDADIYALVIKGEGDRAFCAGGDIKAVFHAHKSETRENDLAELFFKVEYELNMKIKTFKKPYIALINGITMGGGMGISIHGSHRIAGPKTVATMPEAAIGFFPDVGASVFLNDCPGMIGEFIGLTGYRMTGHDAVYAKIATHYMSDESLRSFVNELEQNKWPALTATSQLDQLVQKYAEKASAEGVYSEGGGGDCFLAQHQAQIDRHFAFNELGEIKRSLLADSSDFAQEALKRILAGSPLSQSVVLEQLKRARAMPDFAEKMKMEYVLSQNFIRQGDFIEGIRITIIDRGDAPKWRFSHDEVIPQSVVDSFFRL